jgi:adenylosuccinate lyase
VEYYIKNYMSARQDLQSYTEYVHFTCTSEDINNIAYALMLSSARRDTLQPEFGALYDTLALMADKYKATRMMGRTHGQSATPTTMGKEIANYAYRLNVISNEANKVRFGAKLNGAVGNYNAHQVVYPEFDWIQISREFIESLGLQWTPYSTQIENHDSMCQYFAHQKHLNTVLIGLSRDFWHYISLGYFKQKTVKGEIGSSTMPHKVNPIDFENAEGNFGVANALFGHFTDKLPISRYQRDLSDSTVLRNMGLAFGYTSLSYSSLLKGLKKIDVQEKVLIDELDSHWELLAEPIQMMMRKCGVENPYEKIKEVTRGAVVTEKTIKDFVNALDIDPKIKSGLLSLRPSNYIGYAEKLAGDLKKYTDERH